MTTHESTGRMSLESALDVLARHWVDQVVVGTMTAVGVWMKRRWRRSIPASASGPLGLGVALAQPEREIWVIDGDGSR